MPSFVKCLYISYNKIKMLIFVVGLLVLSAFCSEVFCKNNWNLGHSFLSRNYCKLLANTTLSERRRFFKLSFCVEMSARVCVSLVKLFANPRTSFLKITNHVAHETFLRSLALSLSLYATAFFERRINFSVYTQDKKSTNCAAILRIPPFYSRTCC